ncbi:MULTISPECIES: hypothetical protein [unclassified Ruminococcus]|uniref:hypothetical protein n=1 Tax=unclassified Ruminococcus TaxID=2608920 RepID=UPI00210D52BF|nr:MULTISPECIES: hypothetical protein [unclassified Ruminococcus]MCQ4021967.1 hypothetical protein [Ruminococcus sp. zg-924]MCQ4114503.1 hypothetical protein [Ruminococcus sp. zg-921]
MLKLPVCPYCRAIYRYKDVKNVTHNKNCECHNCKRKFTVSYIRGRVIILAVTAVFLIALNLLMLNFLSGITILGCLILAVLFISLAVILFPFTVRFNKVDGEENKITLDDSKKKKRSQKNRSRKSNMSDK